MRRSTGLGFLLLLCSILGPAAVLHAQIAIPEGLTHEYTLQPGERLDGQLVVASTSEEPVYVTLELRDYLFFADGTTLYEEPGTVSRSNASWIQLFVSSPVLIPPGEELQVPYTIAVPETETLAGTYWCILLVAPAPAEARAEDGLSITTVLSYGIQFVTHIGSTGTRSVRALGASLAEATDGVVLEVDIENDGERWVRPEVWAELYDADGVKIGDYPSGQLRIFPGTSVRYTFALGQLAPGAYRTVIILDDRGLAAWAAQYTLNIVDADG